MRHRKSEKKLGRSGAHRRALMASLVCNLIEEKRITTTLTKAKIVRTLADKMVTLGLKGDLAARRQAISTLRRPERVGKLFAEIAPAFKERDGGYTRIVKLGPRVGDSSEMAILEWVDVAVPDKKKKKKAETPTEE